MPQSVQLLAVGRQLQQRAGFGVAGQLGVVDLVSVIALDHEVGVAAEVLVEEARLVDDIDARIESG